MGYDETMALYRRIDEKMSHQISYGEFLKHVLTREYSDVYYETPRNGKISRIAKGYFKDLQQLETKKKVEKENLV